MHVREQGGKRREEAEEADFGPRKKTEEDSGALGIQKPAVRV